MENPRSLGVPHDTWRPSQKDAFEKAKAIAESGGGDIVIEAPVGTGKSGIAAALGSVDRVLVLVQNHGLLEQYEREYGFKIIKGRQEYPCVLPAKVDQWNSMFGLTPTAADCHFSDPASMCPLAGKCPYVIARNEALSSQRMACTYRYASLSQAVQARSGILVMDEVHNAYEEFINIAQFTLTDSEAKKYKFPKLPLFGFGPGGKGDLLDSISKSVVIDWLMSCVSKISQVNLFDEITPDGSEKQRILDRLMSAVKILNSDKPIFYKCSSPDDDYRSLSSNYTVMMQLRMIDVKDTVKMIRQSKQVSLFMSATIGNPKPLMTMLGVDNYKFHNYPHPVPADKRPVYNLGVDKMTKANLDARPTLYKEQANRITKFISGLDPTWRSIVLSTSNYKIGLLKRFLKETFNGRVFEPSKRGVSDRINEFMSDTYPGRIAVDTIQGWGSGISLVGDIARNSVVAGVPYINPGDRFDQIRTSSVAGRNYGFWNAYSAVVQATGRVSRGELDDNGQFMLNTSALADGSATDPIARRSYPAWFNEAIVDWS